MAHGTDPRELFTRFDGNPIITSGDSPRVVNAVLNPAATTFDGETLLLLRVEDRTGISRLGVARSRDGLTGWVFDAERGLEPDRDRFEERWGDEDPRITKIGDEYLIIYTGFSLGGPLVCLASTKNFATFERRGVLQGPEDKDAALLPEQFGGLWALIHRPVPVIAGVGAHIWISRSPDLRYWGDSQILLAARKGAGGMRTRLASGPLPCSPIEAG